MRESVVAQGAGTADLTQQYAVAFVTQEVAVDEPDGFGFVPPEQLQRSYVVPMIRSIIDRDDGVRCGSHDGYEE